jgi:hypothetical protein
MGRPGPVEWVGKLAAVVAALTLSACGGSQMREMADVDAGGDPPPPESNFVPFGTKTKVPANYKIDDVITFAVPATGTWTAMGSFGGETFTQLTGDVKVVTPLYTFTLGKAQIGVGNRNGVTSSIAGTASVTMPALHTFAGLGLLGRPVTASLGYAAGSALVGLGLPLAPARKYLYFTCTVGFSSSFGTGPFSANTSEQATIVVDPLDPAIFIAGPLGPLSAVALSERSLIPFNANTRWGFDATTDEFPTFTGQSFVAGEIPLEEIPVTVSGDVTTRYVKWDGRSALNKRLFEHTVGVNGSFNLGWDFLDGTFRLEVPLVKASLYFSASAHPYRASIAVSGTAGTDNFLPPWLPVLLSKNSRLAGYIDTADPAKNHLDGASETTIKLSTLGNAIGIKLNDLKLANGTFHADKMGFRFNGESSITPVPVLETGEESKITVCFGGDPVACLSDDHTGTPVMGSRDWIVRMEGRVTVAGVPLQASTMLASPKGVTVAAVYQTQVQRIEMTGSVMANSKVELTGSVSVDMKLNAANEVIAAVVDGVRCGYQQITSAVTCGVSTLNFTDVFHCGQPHCSWSWRHGLRCSSVSCKVTLPNTCNDVGRPKACPPSSAGDFDLGRVSGKVALTVNNDGIAGKLTGTFCPVGGGGCSSLASVGRLDFSHISHPKLCIDSHEISSVLPVGKFCVAF